MSYIVLLLLLSAPAFAQRKTGNALDHLPGNIEVLTHFGERADISPDNQQVAFMDKSFGDAFVIDLKTRTIRCLTCNVPGAAIPARYALGIRRLYSHRSGRIQRYVHTSRTKDNQLWFLSKQPGAKPQSLGQKMSEGTAISKRSLKISYAVTHAQEPALQPEQSQLFVADVTSPARLRGLRRISAWSTRAARRRRCTIRGPGLLR